MSQENRSPCVSSSRCSRTNLSLFSPSQQTHSESQRSAVTQTWLSDEDQVLSAAPSPYFPSCPTAKHSSVIWFIMFSSSSYHLLSIWFMCFSEGDSKWLWDINILSRVIVSIRDWVTSLVLNKRAVGWSLWSWVRRNHNVPETRNHI